MEPFTSAPMTAPTVSSSGKTDGTEAGTLKLKDIRPGSFPDGQPFLYSTAGVGGTLYFDARDGVHGWELWSDGTATGTFMVRTLGQALMVPIRSG